MCRLIILLLAALACFMANAETLVRYSFDDEHVESGPDTFQVFERSRGTARLSSAFRYSGFYSVELRDVAGDTDFPELQGYFPELDSGTLQIHFAFMTPEPQEPFNIALAGPAGFTLQPDGIGFWLKSRNGDLYHVSDSIPRRLQPIEPFVWYLVDIRYHIDAGTYDLRIQEEYTGAPQVNLVAMPNATRTAGSRVNLFSFIGDLPDESSTVYYVDDIEISSDALTDTDELVAPGRRKLFIDYWQDLQQLDRKQPECLPMRSFSDLGIDTPELVALQTAGNLQTLAQVLQAQWLSPATLSGLATLPAIQAAANWRQGCLLLQQRQAREALKYFDLAGTIMPLARLYALSGTLALAALGEFDAVDARIASGYGEWYGDERFAAAQAQIGLAREDHWSSEEILRDVASDLPAVVPASLVELWQGRLPDSLLATLRSTFPDSWRDHLRNRLVTEQYYFLLLWRDGYYEAQEFARQVAAALAQRDMQSATWHEYEGNAAFLAGDYSKALQAYETALNLGHDNPQSVYLKLSDVFFRMADYENERYYREQVYGTLAEQAR